MDRDRSLFRDRALLALLAAPMVLAVQAVVGFAVFRLGCTPAFEDVDFFGVPVTAFLLGALTVAALVLIVFAALHLPRALAQAPERPPGRRLALMLLGVLLAVASFLVAGAWGIVLLEAACP